MGSISAQATRAWVRARRASASPAITAMARAGLAARGVIYILIGWLAIEVALGRGPRHRPSQQGALRLVAGTPYGLVTLWLLALARDRQPPDRRPSRIENRPGPDPGNPRSHQQEEGRHRRGGQHRQPQADGAE